MESIVPQLLEQGLPGLIIIVLGWVSWQLYKRNVEITEKRFEELKESAEALNENSRALEGLADLIKAQIR